MIPTRKQLEEAKHDDFRIYGYFTAFCVLNKSCGDCDRIIRFGCTAKRKIEELQTKRILRICKSESPKEDDK